MVIPILPSACSHAASYGPKATHASATDTAIGDLVAAGDDPTVSISGAMMVRSRAIVLGVALRDPHGPLRGGKPRRRPPVLGRLPSTPDPGKVDHR
jgi:hypothetical protein